jgi:integrase
MSPYLLKRDRVFYFRVRVPTRFQALLRTKEIKLSLKTGKKLRAESIANAFEVEIDQFFARLDIHLVTGAMSQREIDDYMLRWMPRRTVKTKPKKLSYIFSEYVTTSKANWSPKSTQEAGLSLRLATEFFRDCNAADLRVEDAILFQDYLSNTKAEKKDAILNPKTVNKHLSRVGGAFALALKRGHVQVNPFAEIRVTEDSHQRAEDIREPFNAEEINKILQYIVLPHRNSSKPSLYWVPLVSMFTGARLNECCQLYREDITEQNGIGCIKIDDDKQDKRLKTLASRRLVPVHPKLVELGFLEYVGKFKPGQRIFPELVCHRDGYGHSFKKFGPELRKRVTMDKRKTFHSIRHGVATLLNDKGHPTTHRADLLGHTRPGATETDMTYTRKTKLEVMARMVSDIEYVGVDWRLLEP